MRKAIWLTLTFVAAGSLPAQFPDFTPPTPLFRAVLQNDTPEVKRLLQEGADPNETRFFGFPAVFFPVLRGNTEMFRALVEKGADVQARDDSGSTALMWAAFAEAGDATLAKELMRLGVDPLAVNKTGETALTWALRRGHTPLVQALREAGASDAAMVRDAVQRAISLLQKSQPQFVRVSGCVSCHHQSLPQMANEMARQRGITVDEKTAQEQMKMVAAVFMPLRDEMMRGTEKIPDPTIVVSYALLGLGAEGYPVNETTRAMAQLIASKQLPTGGFVAFTTRPPQESSDISATALSLRAMQLYGENPGERVARAAEWLRKASPRTTEDRAMQLMGLAWSGAEPDSLREAAQALLAEQRPDGGWGQLPTLESDAYATGQALYALHRAEQIAAGDPAYQRGAGFLLRTQFPDGSWLVRTRSFPIQPYRESGFPHGKSQWISAAGTSWAAMALMLAMPTQPVELSASGDQRSASRFTVR
jgi:hypothetical protein